MSEANYTIEQSTQEVLLDKAFETTAARKINFEKLARSRAFLSAVIIVLALAIILFALFVPLSRSFADIDGFEVDIKYNGIDVFRLFYCSVLSLSPEGVRSTELYKTTEEMYFDFFS